ncbi:MAG: hypothetical protein IPM75_13920 [Candidatus Competibacteraceae bacterium]|nr:hypothetical protein [Candidatus Competibacteraceae bacterium]
MPRKSMLDPHVQALLDHLHLDGGDEATLAEPAGSDPHPLQALWARLNDGRERALAPGQLAVWKPGLKHYRYPRYGEPAVVMALLDTPLVDPNIHSGSPYYREPQDMVLGVVLGAERAFYAVHADRRRFQPYEPHAVPPPSDG